MRGNDDCTFAKSPILVENVTGDEVVFRSLGTGKSTSEIFGNLLGNLRTSSDIFGHLRILSVPCEKSWHSHDKNVTPMNHKKLADIHGLLHVFKNFAWRTSFRSQLEVPVLSRSAVENLWAEKLKFVWSLSVSNFLKKRLLNNPSIFSRESWLRPVLARFQQNLSRLVNFIERWIHNTLLAR